MSDLAGDAGDSDRSLTTSRPIAGARKTRTRTATQITAAPAANVNGAPIFSRLRSRLARWSAAPRDPPSPNPNPAAADAGLPQRARRRVASWLDSFDLAKFLPATVAKESAADTAPEGVGLLERLREWVGLQAANDAGAEEPPAEEEERLTKWAMLLDTTPLLDENDLKYEDMNPLDDADKALLDWVKRNAGDRLCIRKKSKEGAGGKRRTLAWVITNKPSAEVEAACTLLNLKDWDVIVRPATRRMVERAVVRDQALTATEVEEQFRELLREALDMEASDIHFEMRVDRGITRFRVNGEMQEITREDNQPRFTPKMIEQFGNYMFNRLAKRGSRQFVTDMALNASAQTKVGDKDVALRFSTAPDIRGTDIFVRVWRPDQGALALHELGYDERQINLLAQAIRKPYGVIVFSGPTGSGKSSSLTALLDSLEDAEKERRKIVSLEEPVERELPHVTHVSVSAITEHGGWTALLGGLNRWDSNINVLGEIKDAGSAKALQDIATSGKLLLTTLHASNVLSIPARLEELGVNHQLLYDANFLVLLVNQRLVPRLCPECRIKLWGADHRIADKQKKDQQAEKRHGTPDEVIKRRQREYIDNLNRYRALFTEHDAPEAAVRGLGCKQCAPRRGHSSAKGTGIVGRVLVSEMVAINEDCRQYIRDRDWDRWRASLTNGGWRSIESAVHDHIRDGAVDPADVEKLVCPLGDADLEVAR